MSPETISGSGDTAVNETNQTSCPMGLTFKSGDGQEANETQYSRLDYKES